MSADHSRHPVVHFVGSIPLPDSETVFRTVSKRGRAAPHPPAGRRDRHPQDLDPVPAGRAGRQSRDRARHGRAAVQVRAMGRQGGARNSAPARQARRHASIRRRSRPATPTWRSSRGACSSGCRRPATFPPSVKFQICIPTPIAPTYNNMVPADRQKLLPALTQHFLGEVAKIAKALPNDRIAIQWDVCQEVLAWEGYYDQGPVDFRTETIDVLAKIGDARAGRRSSSAITSATAARPTSTWCSPRTWASWSR